MDYKTLILVGIVIFLFLWLTRPKTQERMNTSEYTSDTTTTDDLDDDYMTSLSTISLEQSDEVKIKIYDTVTEVRNDVKKLIELVSRNKEATELAKEIIDLTDEILIADEYDPEMETKPSEVDGSIRGLTDSIRNYGYKIQKVTTDSGIYDMGIVIESNAKRIMRMYS